jgi:hypothetical protein
MKPQRQSRLEESTARLKTSSTSAHTKTVYRSQGVGHWRPEVEILMISALVLMLMLSATSPLGSIPMWRVYTGQTMLRLAANLARGPEGSNVLHAQAWHGSPGQHLWTARVRRHGT